MTVPYDRNLMMAVIGAKWEPRSKGYRLPLTTESIRKLLCVAGMQFDERLQHMADHMAPPPAASETMPEYELAKMPVKVTPYRHQVKAYNLGISIDNVALLMEMGTGKTLTAIGIMGRRYLSKQVNRVLVVCPLSVCSVWQSELQGMADFPVDILIPVGGSAAKAAQFKAFRFQAAKGVKIVVLNYESCWRPEILKQLKAYCPDMIIADESQRIKNPNAKQSKALHELGDKAPYKLILSGTPVMNSPMDFWSQYRFCKSDLFDSSFFAFKARHAIVGGYEDREIIGYRDLDVLASKAHSIASRVTKREALDLPETVNVRRTFALEPESRRVYDRLSADMVAELEDIGKVAAPHVITRILRLSQITGGFVTVEQPDGTSESTPVSHAKLNALRDELQDLADTGKKVVIFARFRAEIEAITKVASDVYGKDAVRMVWGDTKMDERGKYVKAFQNDPSVRVFVAQIATAGLGITLTAADTAIFYSCDYSYANHEQAKARIHRIGQRNICTYIYLIAEDTVDEAVLQALENKKSLADLVVDRWRSLLKHTQKSERGGEHHGRKHDVEDVDDDGQGVGGCQGTKGKAQRKAVGGQ